MLNIKQARPAIATVVNAFAATSTDMPPPTASAYNRWENVRTALADRPRVGFDDLVSATIDAVEAGRPLETDKHVGRVLVGMDLAGKGGLGELVDARLVAGIVDALGDGDSTIAAWRPAFAAAVAVITDAQVELGNIDLNDTASVVQKGPTATGAWKDATEASRIIGLLDQGWVSLAALLTGSYPDRRFAVLRLVDAAPAQWLDMGLANRPPDPWTATLDGLSLSLPTLDGYRQRVDSATQAAAHRAEQAAQADQQRRHPSLLPG